jgi:hypothetical protein
MAVTLVELHLTVAVSFGSSQLMSLLHCAVLPCCTALL